MACFVCSRQQIDHLFQEQVSVSLATIRALVVGLIGAGLKNVTLDALRHDLLTNRCVLKHAVTVDVDKHFAPTALDHVLTFDHTNDALVMRTFFDRWYSRLILITWLESFTDRAEKFLVSHLVALVTQFEVFAPLVMTFGSGLPRLTILTLDAVLAAEPLWPHVQFLDFIVFIFTISGD